jgi:hypothetical protein
MQLGGSVYVVSPWSDFKRLRIGSHVIKSSDTWELAQAQVDPNEYEAESLMPPL